MTEKMHQERRRFPRINKNLPLSLQANGFDFATTTTNISCLGAYCTIDKYIPPFTKLQIRMSLPAQGQKKVPIECQGVVVRAEDEKNGAFNIAIYFNKIKKTQTDKISDYISRITSAVSAR